MHVDLQRVLFPRLCVRSQMEVAARARIAGRVMEPAMLTRVIHDRFSNISARRYLDLDLCPFPRPRPPRVATGFRVPLRRTEIRIRQIDRRLLDPAVTDREGRIQPTPLVRSGVAFVAPGPRRSLRPARAPRSGPLHPPLGASARQAYCVPARKTTASTCRNE